MGETEWERGWREIHRGLRANETVLAFSWARGYSEFMGQATEGLLAVTPARIMETNPANWSLFSQQWSDLKWMKVERTARGNVFSYQTQENLPPFPVHISDEAAELLESIQSGVTPTQRLESESVVAVSRSHVLGDTQLEQLAKAKGLRDWRWCCPACGEVVALDKGGEVEPLTRGRCRGCLRTIEGYEPAPEE